MLLELCCCCLRASSCCFVTGFGGAGGKSKGLLLPRCPLVLNTPALGGTQGQGHLGMVLGRRDGGKQKGMPMGSHVCAAFVKRMVG